MTKRFSQYSKCIKNNKDLIIEISDKIWNYAKLGFQEYRSSSQLIKVMKEHGFTVNEGIASISTAFVLSYGCAKPVIAVLGEYDALPGLSQTAEPVKKPLKEGAAGHGCGHNLLGTAGIGAVLAIKEVIDRGEVKGTIQYYGCPAEEIFITKGYMINPGSVFDDVDISITWHPGDFNAVSYESNTAENNIIFKFYGQTAHAAGDPNNGRSALDAVELMNIGANYIREHMIPEARIHYVITNGGLAPNVVPDYAEVHYMVRAPERYQVDELYNRLLKIAEGAILMTDTTLEVKYLSGMYNLVHNDVGNDIIYKKVLQVGPPRFNKEEQGFAKEIRKNMPAPNLEHLKRKVQPNLIDLAIQVFKEPLCPIIAPPLGKGMIDTGSTDVADISWNMPLGEFNIACFVLGSPGHSWQCVASSGMGIGHKGMIAAAQVMALTALEFMSNPELVKKACKEFETTFKDKSYKTPFPKGHKLPFPRL